MKRFILSILGVTACGGLIQGQAQVTITSADMFNEAGLTYRSYANKSGPLDPPLVNVGDLIQEPGGPRLWDFTEGPEDQVFRFDYLEANPEVFPEFPNATVMERKTEEDNGNLAYLFFDQAEGIGRRNYGFYDPSFSPSMPEGVFHTPIVDFPDTMRFGDQWSVSTTFDTEILGLSATVTYASTAEADAYGLIDLPNLGFGDVLRVNEEVNIAVAVDLFGDGNFQNVSSDYVRSYYWLRPGHGIAAQMTSGQSSNPVPNNFSVAKFFVRMFETNKEITPGCQEAAPVDDLSMTLSDGRVLLKWTEAECANEYRVEMTENLIGGPWSLLDTVSDLFFLDVPEASSSTRFYRIIAVQ